MSEFIKVSDKLCVRRSQISTVLVEEDLGRIFLTGDKFYLCSIEEGKSLIQELCKPDTLQATWLLPCSATISVDKGEEIVSTPVYQPPVSIDTMFGTFD